MSRNLDLYLKNIIGAIRKIRSYTDDSLSLAEAVVRISGDGDSEALP